MKQLNNRQKKEWAKLLYIKEQMSQKEIAEKVGTTEKTLSKWVTQENWATHKASITITKVEQLKRFYEQINEVNTAILSKPEGQRYANSKEADVLIKLTAAAKNLESETGVSTVIQVISEMIKWLKEEDLAKAKELIVYADLYIKSILK